MKVNPHDPEHITGTTLKHYNQYTEAFWQGTRDHNVSQNIEALLTSISGEPPFTILDFGCGPSRDLKTFRDPGHIAIGLDGAGPFVSMARSHSTCEVWQRDFLKLDLSRNYFDGIFANAALFHVPAQEPGSRSAFTILNRKVC
jgi:trans-aconitate methyltransferase